MLDRRALLLTSAAAGLAGITGCATQPPPAGAPPAAGAGAGDAVARLNVLFERMYREQLAASPETMTSLGLDREAAGAWALARLDERSEAATERDLARGRGYINALKSFDRNAFTGMDRVNYDTMLFFGETAIGGGERFRYGLRGFPQAYVVNQLNAAYTTIPDFLDSQHRIDTAADAEAYLSRVSGYARALDEETARARTDAARGAAPPDFVIDKTLVQLRAARATAAAQNTLVTSIARRTREKSIAGDWGARAQRLVENEVYPALERQIAVMAALRPTATHDAGAWRLPDGEEYYRYGLRYFTTTDLTGEQIHQLGVQQVAEIESRMDQLMRAQGLTQGTVGQRQSGMSKEARFNYPNTAAGKAQLLADLNRQIEAVNKVLPNYFGRLPKANVEVRRVPVDIEAGAPGGYYQSPTLDGSRPGAYYINLRDTAEWPRWSLPTLTYHEANPGHHWQITLALEAEGIPMIRKVTGFSAFSEGWALYSEQLADEIGMYDNDPWGRIGYLQSFLFRAVRLVVDSGLHHKRWSREQAIRYMTEHLGEPESSHVTEVERYCVWPGQACSYKVGQTEWVRLREDARRRLGPRFDIKGFHDTALASGNMPLKVLEGVVDEWVRSRTA